MTRIPLSLAKPVRSIAGGLLLFALVFTVYSGYTAQQEKQDLANGIVKCGEAVMPDDPDVVCSADRAAARYGGGTTREEQRASNEAAANRAQNLAIGAGVISMLLGAAWVVAFMSIRAHTGRITAGPA
jgi:hypothetical protein